MQLGPGSLPGPNFFPRRERNRRLGGVYQIESGLEGGGCRLSPQRNFSPAPLGNPVAPSSVPFGDSFPPKGKPLGCATLHEKSAPNQGTQMGTVITPPSKQCGTTAKTSEWERAGHKNGGPGGLPPALFLPISREKWGPRRAGGPPGRCAPRHRKSRDHSKGTQYPTAPPPGTGREGPRRRCQPAPVQTWTTCRQQSPHPCRN